jgi:uncharacterized protein (TIGR00369 family)
MSDTDIEKLKELFRRAPFIADLAVELESLAAGECITTLDIELRHQQQNGLVHAGVLATMADHTAGAAAFTLVGRGSYVVTAEFKLSLLRAARGERLRCRSKVLKSGRRFSFVESEVTCESHGEELLVAKASATMAVITGGEA